ncbi:MAG: helix-turn-helix domain-containing protein [Pseudonocardiaceae bacterium]
MAPRRQRLSQRRKTVGLTQESLAQRLGVERSTVVRWEAGDTKPLPSIRPKVARALRVSTDQLAELLSESENAGMTRALSAGTEVTIPVLLPKVQSEVWLDRAEFEDLLRPQTAETVEALRSAGAGTEDLDAKLLVGRFSRVPFVAQPVSAELNRPVAVDADPEAAIALGPALSGLPADIALPADVNTAGTDIGLDTPVEAGGFAGSDVPEPARTDVPDLSSVTTIPLNIPLADVQRRRAGSRRFKRFAAAGVLVLVGGAASMPFITADNGPILPATAGHPAPASPVAAIPAPDLDSSNDNNPPGQDSAGAPAAALDKPADGLASSGAAAVPTPKTTRSGNRTTNQSKPPASMKPPPPPRAPAIPAEAEAWSRMAELSGGDQGRTRLRPEPPTRP